MLLMVLLKELSIESFKVLNLEKLTKFLGEAKVKSVGMNEQFFFLFLKQTLYLFYK